MVDTMVKPFFHIKNHTMLASYGRLQTPRLSRATEESLKLEGVIFQKCFYLKGARRLSRILSKGMEPGTGNGNWYINNFHKSFGGPRYSSARSSTT